MSDKSGVTIGPLDWAFIKDKFAKDCPDAEFALLCERAKAVGANPLKSDCYFVWNWDKNTLSKKWSMWLSIDFMRSRAQASGEHQATQRFYDEAKKTATVKIFKTGASEPFTETVLFGEFFPADEKKQMLWKKLPAQMLKKVCEATCLRMAWPTLFEHAYIPEEMDQTNDEGKALPPPPALPPNTGAITGGTTKVTTPPPPPPTPPPSVMPGADLEVARITEEIKAAMTLDELNNVGTRNQQIIAKYRIRTKVAEQYKIREAVLKTAPPEADNATK